MSRQNILAIAFMLMSLATFAQKQSDDFSGRWKTPEGLIVLITKSSATFTGTTEDKKGTILKLIHEVHYEPQKGGNV